MTPMIWIIYIKEGDIPGVSVELGPPDAVL